MEQLFYLKDKINNNVINIEKIGNKAFNLCELTLAKYDVPLFFVITTHVWTQYCLPIVQKYPLMKKLDSIGLEEINEFSEEIRSEIMQLKFENSIKSKIINLFKNFKFKNVAVRSSSILEDLYKRSYSGIYDSFTNVKLERLFESILKCWSSSFSKRSLAYLSRSYKNIKSLKMAVIIQDMMNFE